AAARAIDDVHDRWVRAVNTATTIDSLRGPRLACLDAVVTRAEVVARVFEETRTPKMVASAYLLDPVVCEGERPPRLVPARSDLVREAIATRVRQDGGDASLEACKALVARADGDPCAAAMARLALASIYLTSTPPNLDAVEAEL